MSSKIKVAHLSSVHWAYDTRIHNRMCTSLSTYYEVVLLAKNNGKDEVINPNFKIYSYPIIRNRIIRVLTSWFLVLIRALKFKASIYHIHDPELIPTALLLKLIGKKVIFDIHENIAEDIFDKEWIKFPKLYYNIFSFFEKRVIKTCYLILAEKSYEVRYKKLKAKNYSIIYNYCKVKDFVKYQTIDKSAEKIFYSGILFENRGVLQILEAIYLLKKDHKLSIEFHCVGPLYHELNQKIIALPFYNAIKDQLFFYGRKKNQEAYELSKPCGIGLSIIHPMSNSIESYPTKIFEYMACGMPTIASNFPLYKSIIEDINCGINVNPLDSNAIALAILKLNNNNKVYKSMAKNSIEIVQKQFNWATEEEKLLNIYKTLLKE